MHKKQSLSPIFKKQNHFLKINTSSKNSNPIPRLNISKSPIKYKNRKKMQKIKII